MRGIHRFGHLSGFAGEDHGIAGPDFFSLRADTGHAGGESWRAITLGDSDAMFGNRRDVALRGEQMHFGTTAG
ncbi:hypothetical protein D3C73_1599650 [compost metagenome]